MTYECGDAVAMENSYLVFGNGIKRKIGGLLTILLLAATSSLCAALTTTTTTISSSLNPSVYGQAVTFTAAVTSSDGTPPDGETITFLQGSNVIGTGSLSGGSAMLTIATLTASTDNIKATYPGDANFKSSTAVAVKQAVSKATSTTSLTSSPNPSNSGQTVILSATVMPEYSGTATGTVSFYSGSTKLGSTVLSGGMANFSSTKLAVGTDSITAVYGGGTSFVGSTSSVLSQSVGGGTTVNATLTWNGVTRYYEVFVPSNLPANPPMLLMLHGTRTTPTFDPQAVTSLTWGWQPLANQYGFILVQPASTYDASTHQWNWNAYYMDAAFPAPAPDDSGFLRQLIMNLTTQYNVNPNQVYLAGFSSGAQMAHRVGVESSDLVAALVIASGTIVGQLDPPPIVLPGPAVAPISIQEWHGTADTGIPPCNNGTTVYSAKSFYLATVDQSFDYWTQQNACTQFQNSLPLCSDGTANPGTTGNDATGCSAGTEVQFIWERNVTHSWQQQNDTARWLFLAAHPKQ